MTNIRISSLAVLLTVASGAWAGGGVYPPETSFDAAAGKTRAQVIAELHEAQRLGLLVAYFDGNPPSSTPAQERMIADAGLRAIGQASVLVAYDSEPAGDAVTVWGDARLMRLRIVAEAREALRLGLISVGEGDRPVATEAQEQMIALAGRRAVEALRASDQLAHVAK